MNTLFKSATFEKAEKAFVVLSLIHYSSGILPIIIAGGSSEGDGAGGFNYGVMNYFYLLNYFIAVFLIALRWKQFIKTLSSSYLYHVLVAIVPLSILWSTKPDVTMSASIAMFGNIIFGAYVASRFTIKQQLELMKIFSAVVILLSILFVVALPKYGIQGGIHAGSIRGIYGHKNTFGPIMSLSCIIFMLDFKNSSSKFQKYSSLVGLIFSIALVFAANSSSALINTAIMLMFVSAAGIFRLKGFKFALSLLLLSAFSFVIRVWFERLAVALLGLFEKDLTLTGRTDLWPLVVAKIQERPLLGYGFNGFWHGNDGESLYIWNAIRWTPPNSHNGFLDLALSLGIIGIAVFFILFWSSVVKNIALLRVKFRWHYVWPLSYFIFLVLKNFSESSLMSQNSFHWVVFTISVLAVSEEFNNLVESNQQHYSE